MRDIATRTSRGLGWLLFTVGLVVLVGYAVYEFAVDETVPALRKIAVAGLIVGLVLLFVSVVIQRVQARRTERYVDVER